jgi:hypothetical protein
MHVFGKLTQSVLQRNRSHETHPTPLKSFLSNCTETTERTNEESTWRSSCKPVIQLNRNFDENQGDNKNFDVHVFFSNHDEIVY